MARARATSPRRRGLGRLQLGGEVRVKGPGRGMEGQEGIREQVAGVGAVVGRGSRPPFQTNHGMPHNTTGCPDNGVRRPEPGPTGKAAATHPWAWGWEGRLICQGSLGGAPGMGGDSQNRSACSPHILLFCWLYPLGM